MTPAQHHQPTAFSSSISAVQPPRHQQQQSKATGSHPHQQPLAALAGSPTGASNGAGNCDPDVVRQLPEVVRHVLHGCVSTGHGTVERGAHLTIYVTSADPAGNKFRHFLIRRFDGRPTDVDWTLSSNSPSP